jgi:adenine-specific DNA-methyltransferase
MEKRQRLELTWIGKENRPRLEPRILLENPSKSHHAKTRVTDHDIFDNCLIFGDNLLALKALEQEFAGKVKCTFIDPPYNTGSAFTHYDDGVEHSLWLSLMRDRLELIRRLLSHDGSLWITIDDVEAHYLKVLCDEVFGRSNFVANVIWQKRFSPNSTAQYISDSHDHVLVYARDKGSWKRKLLPRHEKHNSSYKNPDKDPRGPWTSGDLSARNSYSSGIYPIETPSGRVISGPPKGMYWRVSQEKFRALDKDKRIWWGTAGDNVPRLKRFLSEVMEGVVPQTIWTHDEVGHTQEAKKEVMSVVPSEADVFQTPKPERLIRRILELSSEPGDLILDSFGGSGTTGAVAHKMGRRWIMVELGEHCHTHIIPRLNKVIDGENPGGITQAVNWKGGGGFRYYRIAPSLLEKDKFGNWVISKQYNAEMLSEAMCKLEVFTYAPSETEYWNHGHSTEQDFIFVTTQTLSREQLTKLSDEVGENRSLLVCCSAFRVKDLTQFPNLTVKKIPKMVLNRCEWGHDDYSLEIENLPSPPPEVAAAHEPAVSRRNGKKTKENASMSLFAAVAETEGQD